MSIRRTTTIDSWWPEGPSGPLLVDARARDLIGGPHPVVLDAAAFVLRIDGATRSIVSMEPELDTSLKAIREAPIGQGFRRTVASVFERGGVDVGEHGVVHALLDDLAVTTMISGYAHMRANPPTEDSPATRERFAGRVDLCAGYTAEGTIGTWVAGLGHSPVPVGPPAPSLAAAPDDGGWHELPPAAPNSMRRTRRLDLRLREDGTVTIDAMFRDVYVAMDGAQDVLHEYGIDASYAATSNTITAIEATPHVLPWQECPAAAASAQFVVGVDVTSLRRRVLDELRGPSTCTHLNDELRFLADVGWLARVAEAGGGPTTSTPLEER
jgi:hypothetical protein